MNKETKGYTYILLGGCIWGSAGLFVTIMSSFGAGTSQIAFLRVFFAFIIMAVYIAFRYGLSSFKISLKSLGICILLGLICHGIYNAVYSVAVLETGVAASSIMLRMAPVFTAMVSAPLFSEKIGPRKIALLALNIFGCILAITGGDFQSFGRLCLLGIVCGIAAAFTHSLTPVISRIGASSNTNPAVMSVYSYLAASVFLLVFTHPFAEGFIMNTGITVTALLYALFPTSISFLVYYKGSAIIKETSKIPALSSVESIVAAIIGACFLHETFSIVHLTGLIIVLVSIVLLSCEKIPVIRLNHSTAKRFLHQ